jgi:hypothetical protein
MRGFFLLIPSIRPFRCCILSFFFPCLILSVLSFRVLWMLMCVYEALRFLTSFSNHLAYFDVFSTKTKKGRWQRLCFVLPDVDESRATIEIFIQRNSSIQESMLNSMVIGVSRNFKLKKAVQIALCHSVCCWSLCVHSSLVEETATLPISCLLSISLCVCVWFSCCCFLFPIAPSHFPPLPLAAFSSPNPQPSHFSRGLRY